MKIFGKSLSEYYRFQKVILGLIVVVGLGRLVLSLAGVPNSSAKWLSITGVVLIGLIYYSVRVYTTGFGTYKHLLPLLAIQSILAQAIIILAIALAIFTGTDNIYSSPEYSGGVDGKTWLHAGAHLVFGTIAFTLVGWGLGSLIMFVTKKVSPRGRGQATPTFPKDKAAAAGAK